MSSERMREKRAAKWVLRELEDASAEHKKRKYEGD